jgi:hypothetical protein
MNTEDERQEDEDETSDPMHDVEVDPKTGRLIP